MNSDPFNPTIINPCNHFVAPAKNVSTRCDAICPLSLAAHASRFDCRARPVFRWIPVQKEIAGINQLSVALIGVRYILTFGESEFSVVSTTGIYSDGASTSGGNTIHCNGHMPVLVFGVGFLAITTCREISAVAKLLSCLRNERTRSV